MKPQDFFSETRTGFPDLRRLIPEPYPVPTRIALSITLSNHYGFGLWLVQETQYGAVARPYLLVGFFWVWQVRFHRVKK